MAKVFEVPGSEGYVNEGERRVVESLAAGLPDDGYLIIPNIQIPHDRSVDEIDAIVITPDSVILVETKDLAGQVQVTEQDMLVNGESRGNPVLLTLFKSKRLMGKVKKQVHGLGGTWFGPLVVLARQPQMLQIAPTMQHRVVMVEEAVEQLLDPSKVVMNEGFHFSPGGTVGKVEQIVAALGLKPRPKLRAYGTYRATEQLQELSDAEVFKGEHRITGQSVLLKVVKISSSLSVNAAKQARKRAFKALTDLAKVKDTSHVAVGANGFTTDGGSAVIVTPLDHSLPLTDYLAAHDTGTPERLRLLEGMAKGIAALHAVDICHGRFEPAMVLVTPGGQARVNLHDRTEEAVNDNRFAPAEVADGSAGFATTDLYALGRMVEWLWPDDDDGWGPSPIGPPPDKVAALVDRLTADTPALRSPTAAEVAEIAAENSAPSAPEPALSAPAQPSQGVTIGGYLFEEELRGSEGRSWRATDTATGLPCAVKVLVGDDAQATASAQFMLLHRLSHPSIVAVRDVHVRPTDTLLVTEWVKGDVLAHQLESGFAPDPQTAVDLVLTLVDGLGELHRSNDPSAHRDVRPTNLVLTSDRLVLVDFDRAVREEDLPADDDPYLPPDDDPSTAAGGIARDLWGAACVLQDLLSASGRTVPSAMQSLLDDFLAADRSRRPQSAEEFTHRLQAAAAAIDGVPVANLSITYLDSEERTDVQSAGPEKHPTATVHRFEVRADTGEVMVCDVVEAPEPLETGHQGVVVLSEAPADPKLQKLCGSRRIGIFRSEDGGWWAILRQAQLTPHKGSGWNNVFKATESELDEGAGANVRAVLSSAGGTFDTRRLVPGVPPAKVDDLCVKFDSFNAEGFAVAHALVRVLPIMNGVTHDA